MSNLRSGASISRPTMYFCKLPPESDLRRGLSGPVGLDFVALDNGLCLLDRQRPPCVQPPPRARPTSVRVSKRLCATGSSDGHSAPRPKRSSGTKCKTHLPDGVPPDPKPETRLDSQQTRDWLRRTARTARVSSPDKAYSSSLWPLPDTPAIPTTSPARTCEVHALANRCRNGSSLRKAQTLARDRTAALAPAPRAACMHGRGLGADHQAAEQRRVALLARVAHARELVRHASTAQCTAQRADFVELVR